MAFPKEDSWSSTPQSRSLQLGSMHLLPSTLDKVDISILQHVSLHAPSSLCLSKRLKAKQSMKSLSIIQCSICGLTDVLIYYTAWGLFDFLVQWLEGSNFVDLKVWLTPAISVRILAVLIMFFEMHARLGRERTDCSARLYRILGNLDMHC